MQDNILLTKLKRPPVAPDIVPRDRLSHLLDEGNQRTLTLISAPAGYGKSTLASRWVAGCGDLSAWVSLGESDNDLRVFLSYLLAAMRSLFPNTQLRTEVLLEANPLPSVSVLARQLINDIHQTTDPFILVFDDYHLIIDPDVNELLSEILAHPPMQMHLVLITRHDPPLPLARLRGRGQLTEIRAAGLRFTADEMTAFLAGKLNLPMDDATLELLNKKTEGWAAGLRLVGLYLQDKKDVNEKVQALSGSSQHIADYLMTEVLSRQHPEMLAYLIETSILDRFCPPLCEVLHRQGAKGENRPEQIAPEQFIGWLIKANLFIVALDDKGRWFRFHHLFQVFLNDLLRKRRSADQIAALHRAAGEWFAENGLIEEAISHALAAGDTKAAVRLVLDNRYDLMNNSDFQRMHRWLMLLPKDAVSENPLLLMTQAFLGLEWGLETDWFACMEQARRRSDYFSAESQDASTLIGEIALMQSVMDLMLGQPATIVANAQKSLSLLPKDALFSRSTSLSVLAASHQLEGNCRQSVALMEDTLADPKWPVIMRLRMWAHLCIVTFMDADSSGVLRAGHGFLQTAETIGFRQPASYALCILGAVHYLRNELTKAKKHLASVLNNPELSEEIYIVISSGFLCFIHLAEGCPGEAVRIISSLKADALHKHDSFARTTMNALLVELALRQGKLDEAESLSHGVDFDHRPPHWRPYVPQLTRVKLLLAQATDRSLKEALSRLIEMDQHMRRINRKNVRIDVLALLALVYHKKGQVPEAMEQLSIALDLAEPGGWVRNFVDLGIPMTRLLERLVRHQPGHSFAQQVLDVCRTECQANASSGSDKNGTADSTHKAPAAYLTPRETELVSLLAEGLTNKEIANRLHIATETVKTHLQKIFQKLNAKNRLEAVRQTQKLGLLKRD
jgi:LuxR family maltose regulon positive regulatory protein